MKSNRFKLTSMDWWLALATAMIAPMLLIVFNWANGDSNIFDWHSMLKMGISGGSGYVISNLFTNTVSDAKKTIEKAGGEVIEPSKYGQ